ncbi:hypothetical protein QBZ16_003773 [Prototheca wickerhamii]|uniref:PCI domain-containing protein n=1 Tax=Prototheca wickerhamii TaxID=3111 RepID=A0AAD9IIQ4_PROWI|nr:hypothetical protein QBZ16_003773 [Prototheca wickerhamii]
MELATASPEGERALQLLQAFAFGTWGSLSDALRQELTAAQEQKLRVLTVLSLAADQRVLGYEEIRSALGLPGLDEAEDLLIQDVVGPGLIKGRLDQPGERLLIVSSTPRDVEQSRLAGVADQLSSWLEAMDGAMAALGQARQATDQGASALASSRAEQATQEQAARRAVAETPSQMPSAFDNATDGPGGALGGEESEAMPFEGVTPQGPRLSKRRR